MNIALTTSNTPTTAIPTNLNGSNTIQTKGYTTNTASAKGQQITSRMHHSKNVSMVLIRTEFNNVSGKKIGSLPNANIENRTVRVVSSKCL